ALLRSAADKWNEHHAPRLGASLAYYTLLSLAPLLILLMAICGFAFGHSAAESNLLYQARALVGYSGANTLKTLIDSAHHAKNGIIAGVAAVLTMLFGASGVFVELQDSLNLIWDAPPRKFGWLTVVKQRAASFGMVLALGFLLVVSLLLSAALGVVETYFSGLISMHAVALGEAANFVISLVAVAVLFALIFKFVPDVPVDWRDVIIGAVATAILFSIGRALLGFYLKTAAVGSTYGAAGSLVALVVWIYYSAQIFFFGAVFTRVYADYRKLRRGLG
ncbi:MAG TPA: YihY/virulence factor BrkB family protein, partial [Bryobacteraceae bacterium]